MFRQISWLSYFIGFSGFACLYYAFMTRLFFKKQISRVFSRSGGLIPGGSSSEGNGLPTADDYSIYEKLRTEITAYLEGEEEETFKSDILFSIVTIIKSHAPLRDERFREVLGKEIRRIYNGKYNDSLTESELNSLWKA